MELGSWKYSGEIILLLVQTILNLSLGVMAFVGVWWNKTKQSNIGWKLFCFAPELDGDDSLSCSLRVSATQDTDKPEIQPVSEPESLHSCVLSCMRVGQA